MGTEADLALKLADIFEVVLDISCLIYDGPVLRHLRGKFGQFDSINLTCLSAGPGINE